MLNKKDDNNIEYISNLNNNLQEINLNNNNPSPNYVNNSKTNEEKVRRYKAIIKKITTSKNYDFLEVDFLSTKNILTSYEKENMDN